jgi:hypothetical protein
MSAVPLTGSGSFIVNQPPGESFLLTEVLDDRTKIDLDFSARANRASMIAQARVAAAMLEPNIMLEGELGREMLVGGSTAMVLFRAWIGNTVLNERNFAALDADTATTPGFTAAAGRFEAKVNANLREQWGLGKVDYHDLVTGKGPTHLWSDTIPPREPGRATARLLTALEPPSPSLSLIDDTPVKICIGSFQGVKVFLSDFKVDVSGPTYQGTLNYELRDHFGVDDDDCEIAIRGLHGTPGQVAMWVLQHHRRPGHVPWITLVKVKRAIRGLLA